MWRIQSGMLLLLYHTTIELFFRTFLFEQWAQRISNTIHTVYTFISLCAILNAIAFYRIHFTVSHSFHFSRLLLFTAMIMGFGHCVKWRKTETNLRFFGLRVCMFIASSFSIFSLFFCFFSCTHGVVNFFRCERSMGKIYNALCQTTMYCKMQWGRVRVLNFKEERMRARHGVNRKDNHFGCKFSFIGMPLSGKEAAK